MVTRNWQETRAPTVLSSVLRSNLEKIDERVKPWLEKTSVPRIDVNFAKQRTNSQKKKKKNQPS